jgi:pimeloyl-ACP methyl ester carboxylesterase
MPTIRIGNDHFNVLDQGDGPALLFVHGFPLNHTMWNAQIEEFTTAHRVIAPDLRGFGQSAVTAGTVTMEQHADDLVAILDKLGVEKTIYCGLSMGGYIAWQFAHKFSDRLAGLVLCDTRVIADTDEVRDGRFAMAEAALADGPATVAETMLPKLVGPDAKANQPDVVDAIREMIMTTAPDGIAAALQGMAHRSDMTDSLDQIVVQTLVIVGEYDEISRAEEMRGIADAIAGSQFIEIPTSGHMTPMENAGAVNDALRDFLK